MVESWKEPRLQLGMSAKANLNQIRQESLTVSRVKDHLACVTFSLQRLRMLINLLKLRQGLRELREWDILHVFAVLGEPHKIAYEIRQSLAAQPHQWSDLPELVHVQLYLQTFAILWITHQMSCFNRLIDLADKYFKQVEVANDVSSLKVLGNRFGKQLVDILLSTGRGLNKLIAQYLTPTDEHLMRAREYLPADMDNHIVRPLLQLRRFLRQCPKVLQDILNKDRCPKTD